SKVRPAQLIEPPHARGRTSVQHQDLGTDVSKDALSGPLVGDVGRDDSDAELLLHRCERGRVAGHDGHLGALVHQGLDKPETQATAAASHHDRFVLEAHRPLPRLMPAEPRTFALAENGHCWPAWRRGRQYQAGMRRARALLRRQVWGKTGSNNLATQLPLSADSGHW